jgi:hypothetical protein
MDMMYGVKCRLYAHAVKAFISVNDHICGYHYHADAKMIVLHYISITMSQIQLCTYLYIYPEFLLSLLLRHIYTWLQFHVKRSAGRL